MFFIFPFRVKNTGPQGPFPTANIVLILVNILLYFTAGFFGWSLGVGRGTHPLTLITYAFGHFNIWHLIGNMWALWLIGNPVNRRLGNIYYLLAYFATVLLLGIFGWIMVGTPIVGSSGIIFALLLIFIMLMPTASIDLVVLALLPITFLIGLFAPPREWYFWLIRWGVFSIGARTLLWLVPLLEIFGLLWSGWNWNNLAHLAGLLVGVAIVLTLPTRITMRRAMAG